MRILDNHGKRTQQQGLITRPQELIDSDGAVLDIATDHHEHQVHKEKVPEGNALLSHEVTISGEDEMTGEPCGKLEDDSASDCNVYGVGVGGVLGVGGVVVVVGPGEEVGGGRHSIVGDMVLMI